MRNLRTVFLVAPMLFVGFGCVLLALSAKRIAPAPVVATTDCRAYDQVARERVAALVGDDSAVNDLRLDEALAQLRRARKLCRSGLIAAAENDYRAIERAVASEATSSIKTRR